MTQEEHGSLDGLVADASDQAMQEIKEVLASLDGTAKKFIRSYQNHFHLTYGQSKVAQGVLFLGIGIFVASGGGEAVLGVLAANSMLAGFLEAIAPTMAIVDPLFAVFGITGNLGTIALGAAEWSTPWGQPDERINELSVDFMSDPIVALFAPMSVIGGHGFDSLEKGIYASKVLSLALQGVGTSRLLVDPTSSAMAKTVSAFGTIFSAGQVVSSTDAGGQGTQGQNQAHSDAQSSRGTEREVFGRPEREFPRSDVSNASPDPAGEPRPMPEKELPAQEKEPTEPDKDPIQPEREPVKPEPAKPEKEPATPERDPGGIPLPRP